MLKFFKVSLSFFLLNNFLATANPESQNNHENYMTPKARRVPNPSCEIVIDSKDASRLGDFLVDLDAAFTLFNSNPGAFSNHPLREKLRFGFLRHVKKVLEKINSGEIFHPTPLANLNVNGHVRGIQGLSAQQFKQCDVEKYVADTASPYTRVITTTHGNKEVDTGEWHSLSALLRTGDSECGKYKEDNFLHALFGRSPSSPSGVCNVHHIYQSEVGMTRLPKSVHNGRYAELHPARHLKSSIDRKRFAKEREELNVHWALRTALTATADILVKYQHRIDEDTQEGNAIIKLAKKHASPGTKPLIIREKSTAARFLDFGDDNSDSDSFLGDISNTSSRSTLIRAASSVVTDVSVARSNSSSEKEKQNNGLNANAKPWSPKVQTTAATQNYLSYCGQQAQQWHMSMSGGVLTGISHGWQQVAPHGHYPQPHYPQQIFYSGYDTPAAIYY
jgi:hypothetical protein